MQSYKYYEYKANIDYIKLFQMQELQRQNPRGVYSVLQLFIHVRFFATSQTVPHQALLPMGFSRQKYLSGCRGPAPADPGYSKGRRLGDYFKC